MTLLNELTVLITELDIKGKYPYILPQNLLTRFSRFREAMELVATTMDDRKGRALLRKYQYGERGQQLSRLEADKPTEKSALLLMLEFCQDATQLEDHLKRSWKRNEKLLN